MTLRNGDDLALAYTPVVAGPCLEIAKDKEKAYEYTIKGKTVAIPIYHDDQHGTAIAVLAGLYNALKIVNKLWIK